MSDDAMQPPLPASAGPGPRLAPVSSSERITLIDALRGFALAGVRRGYYRKPLEDAMVLRRRLDPSNENDPLEGQTG